MAVDKKRLMDIAMRGPKGKAPKMELDDVDATDEMSDEPDADDSSDDEDYADEGDATPEELHCAGDLMDAIKKDDPQGIVDAVKAIVGR